MPGDRKQYNEIENDSIRNAINANASWCWCWPHLNMQLKQCLQKPSQLMVRRNLMPGTEANSILCLMTSVITCYINMEGWKGNIAKKASDKDLYREIEIFKHHDQGKVLLRPNRAMLA